MKKKMESIKNDLFGELTSEQKKRVSGGDLTLREGKNGEVIVRGGD